jgi:hypothetical protein
MTVSTSSRKSSDEHRAVTSTPHPSALTHHAAEQPAHAPSEGETSWAGRIVALATPVLAVFAGWVAGWVAQEVPGAHLDQGQVTAFMVAATTTVLGAAWKWLQGWQQHERAVAHGLIRPRGRRRK